MGQIHLNAEIAKGHICFCGHHGKDHAGTEPRVCKVISCSCYQFRSQNPYAMHLSNIDRFVEQFEEWEQRFDELCKMMPFLYGLNNTEIIFWYWKYVYPLYDPEEEFLTPELKTAIHSKAKPEAITRGFRAHKAKHRDQQNQFKNLKMWQSYQEAGYREGAIASKS